MPGTPFAPLLGGDHHPFQQEKSAMRKKATTTTPDPEYAVPKPNVVEVPPPPVLGGENARGETAGCPTGLADSPQGQQPQQPGAGAATAAPAKAAAATAAAALLGPGLIDRQRPAVNFLAIHRGDGRLGFLVGAHFDEAKALGTAGVAVHDDLGGLDRAVRREHLFEVA